MKQLKEELKFNGFNYKQIKRTDKIALYSQNTKKGKLVGYELFIIPTHNGYKIANKEFLPSEYFAKDEHFGKTAWSLKPCLGYALQKFNELEQEIKNN